jgi:outer membrane protein assembly factor BamB
MFQTPMAALMLLTMHADWPRFRGPTGQGESTEKSVPLTWGPKENLTWKTRLPGPGSSSPIVVKGKAYLTCYSGYNEPGKPMGSQEDLRLHVVCIDAVTGKIEWDRTVKPRLPEQERIREGHGYASSTPACDGERVYAFFGRTGVFAFSLEGKQLWHVEVGSEVNGFGSGASPVVHGDVVIVNASVESESVVGLDRKTGKEKWRARGVKEAWGTPVVVASREGKSEMLLGALGKLMAIDPEDGSTLWTCKNDITWYIVPSPVAQAGVAYSIGGRSGVAAVAVKLGGKGDVTSTHRLWTGKTGSNVSSPVLHKGHLYFVNDGTGVAHCLKADTGEAVYSQRLPRGGSFYASAVLSEGRVYYLSRDGRTFVVEASPEYKLLATNDLGERSMFNATPAVAEGKIFIRSDGHLYCIAKKE